MTSQEVIYFNKCANFQTSHDYINNLLNSNSISSNSTYTKQCESFLEQKFGYKAALLTSSCTAALEIIAMIIKQHCGDKDEIILPSFTFVSTANAFAKFGFKIRFIDVKPCMNIDEQDIIKAITPKTAAVVAVNYGGFSSDLEFLSKECKERHIFFVEDNAQGIDAKFNDQYLGSFGDFSTFSFHDTKNVTSGGEGGAFICNNPQYLELAKIIREKGTNREQFFRGQVDKYTWLAIGGHYLMSELQAAFLLGQLNHLDEVTKKRRAIWQHYYDALQPLAENQKVELQQPQSKNHTNGHMFFLKCKNLEERTALIAYLKDHNIITVFHYLPLHSSPAGQKHGTFVGNDTNTTRDSERLIRLPVWFDLTFAQVDAVQTQIKAFYDR